VKQYTAEVYQGEEEVFGMIMYADNYSEAMFKVLERIYDENMDIQVSRIDIRLY
jgi:hypothetical protein